MNLRALIREILLEEKTESDQPFSTGKTYRIDSGLGGKYSIKFRGKTKDGRLRFKVTNTGFTGIEFLLTPEQASQRVTE